MSLENQIDPEMMQNIMEQFEKIKQQAGIEPDDESKKEIEELLGFTMEEFDVDINRRLKTRTLQVKKYTKMLLTHFTIMSQIQDLIYIL
jgi:hypothetical protein